MSGNDVCSMLNSFSPTLFPSSYKDGYIFVSILILCSIIIICYCLIRIQQQKRQLKLGEIEQMNFWLLPLYYKFLWCLIIIFIIQAIDTIILYLLLQHKIPYYYAIIHAAIFWSSSFWLINFILFFLINKSHGYGAIKISFYISIVILIINTTLFSIEIILNSGYDISKNNTLYLSTIVYILQCMISIIILCIMFYKSYRHYYPILWILTVTYLIQCFLRFIYNTLPGNINDHFCLIDVADYIQNILLPIFIIMTLKKDSNHWILIKNRVLTAHRESISKALQISLTRDISSASDQQQYVSMNRIQEWTELLSQHTTILNPRKVIKLPTNKQTTGASANIIKAQYENELIAIKEWKFGEFNKRIIALWCKEVLIAACLNHKNIVKLKGILIEPPTIKIVMKWCLYGSLHKMLLDSSINLPWNLRYSFLIDIANGVNHLHKNGFIYRDLKSLNLLVDKGENIMQQKYMIKLCDFGSTALFDGNTNINKEENKEKEEFKTKINDKAAELSTAVGSIPYLAPEILKNIEYKRTNSCINDEYTLSLINNKSTYGKSVDVFSYGYIIWEITTRRPLYHGKTQRDIKQSVVQQNIRPIIHENDLKTCPDGELLKNLMNECWNTDPLKRPSFDQILQVLQSRKHKFWKPDTGQILTL